MGCWWLRISLLRPGRINNRATLEFRESGNRVRCIGSNPSGAHGLRPFPVLADEPAQWEPAKAERMVAAVAYRAG